jgi:hypothetical protein
VMYAVALFFAIFICSTLFYSCNANSSHISSEEVKPLNSPVEQPSGAAAVTMAMR